MDVKVWWHPLVQSHFTTSLGLHKEAQNGPYHRRIDNYKSRRQKWLQKFKSSSDLSRIDDSRKRRFVISSSKTSISSKLEHNRRKTKVDVIKSELRFVYTVKPHSKRVVDHQTYWLADTSTKYDQIVSKNTAKMG